MITRGESSILVQKIYHYCGDKPFTYKKVAKKLPYIKKSLMTAMHNANVVGLRTGKSALWESRRRIRQCGYLQQKRYFSYKKCMVIKND